MNESKVIYIRDDSVPSKQPFYEKKWFKVFGRIVSFCVGIIPPLKNFIANSTPNLVGRIPALFRQEKYNEALELSLYGLSKCDKNTEIYYYFWWLFMGYAAYCAYCLDNSEMMDSLCQRAESGPEPFEGSQVAYCFCYFSHFKYSLEEYDSAIRFAEIAKKADDNSGEAYYLLGYYDLFIKEKDPVELFSAAIKRDHKILNRIVHHPSIKEFPGIIAELTKLHPISSNESPNQGSRRGSQGQRTSDKPGGTEH